MSNIIPDSQHKSAIGNKPNYGSIGLIWLCWMCACLFMDSLQTVEIILTEHEPCEFGDRISFRKSLFKFCKSFSNS